MKKIKWIIEPEVFQDRGSFEDALTKLGVNHVVCKFGISYQ